MDEIELQRNGCRDKLEALGRPRITQYDQQLHLLGIAESFQRLVKSATDGNWNDLFFKDTESGHGYERRMRAVVQNLNDNFAKRLSGSGCRRHIADSKASGHIITSVTRDEFIDHIQNKMRSSRGRELPVLFDPMIIADLFRDQASPWEQLARDHIDSSWKACKVFLKHVIAHVADLETSTSLSQKVIGPAMDDILAALRLKTSEVLKPHQQIHPITYNHYFTETIQKVRADRKRSDCASAVKRFFGVSTLGQYTPASSVDLSRLVDILVGGTTEPDMNRFAASEALDHMDAYYKVRIQWSSRKRVWLT
jgi:hypothetical protein